MYAPPPQPPPPKSGFPTWAIVLIVVAGGCIVVLPVVSVLAVYGVRKYLANAKTAEARASLKQIAMDAAQTYQRDHALCPSASTAVPVSMSMLHATKYQSVVSDWQIDARRRAGFACLGFAIEEPQYFQYWSPRTSPTSSRRSRMAI